MQSNHYFDGSPQLQKLIGVFLSNIQPCGEKVTDLEVLIDFLDDLERDVHQEIESLSYDDLLWQPAPKSNNISRTVWHFSRWLDLLTVRALQNRPAEEEQWHVGGWVDQTGYDPRGIGAHGFGAITGYTWEEVQKVPNLSAPELLEYFTQAKSALRQHLQEMPAQQLHQPTPGLGRKRTVYQWIQPILKGCFWHIGEIQAIKAMKAQVPFS